MAQVASPPTARVLDVLELLAASEGRRLRLSEIADALDLALGTAHNILVTLAERGWVDRDAGDKTFAVGPGLGIAATRAGAVPTPAVRARALAAELAAAVGCAASVVELAGSHLVITTWIAPDDSQPRVTPGETFPFAPPFGAALAAWQDAPAQQSWIDRARLADDALVERLREGLAATRRRGYDVDRTTPALTQAAHLLGGVDVADLPASVRQARDRLAEFAALGFLADDEPGPREVYSISTPLLDDAGRPVVNLSLHPMRRMTERQVAAMGRRLVAACVPARRPK